MYVQGQGTLVIQPDPNRIVVGPIPLSRLIR
jgi:hypothetical protein